MTTGPALTGRGRIYSCSSGFSIYRDYLDLSRLIRIYPDYPDKSALICTVSKKFVTLQAN